MGKGIKTRNIAEKGIKAIDKAAVASERMKEAYIRTRDNADHSLYAAESSPGEYASDRLSSGVDSVTHEAIHQFDKQGRKGIKTTKENISKVKENIQKRKAAAEQPKKQAKKQAARKTRQTADKISEPVRTLRQERGAVKTLDRGKKSIKTVDRGRKTIKQASSTAKGTVKTASKSIKTAEKTAKASIKTTQQVAKTAQKTAQATARAARAAAHAARAAAKAAVTAAKVAVKATIAAVYAVKITTDPDAAQEVATMDDSKKQLLKDIFWQMNEISSSTSTQTETIIETSDDGNGNIVETEVTVTRTYLYITVSHKTAEEMADQFSFHEDQREQMAELLVDENNSLWNQMLYGITGGDGEIVTVALSQVGNTGGAPYWSWYGFGSRVEWCACFVSWCANECGYIDAGVIPKFAACASQGVPWFKECGLWQDNSYEPRPGDIIFFDWDDGGQDGSSDHVGIAEKVENGRIYTVEGNSGDSVRQNSYPVGYYEIYGYGTPAY